VTEKEFQMPDKKEKKTEAKKRPGVSDDFEALALVVSQNQYVMRAVEQKIDEALKRRGGL
jgi:hypothetical protein